MSLNLFIHSMKMILIIHIVTRSVVIALAPKPELFVVGLRKGYGAQLIDSSLL